MTERGVVLGLVLALGAALGYIGYQLSSTPNIAVTNNQSAQQVHATLSMPSSLFSSTITRTQDIDIVVSLPNNAFAIPSQSSPQYLTIILTGCFTLFGSVVVLIYNYIAGDSTRKFEWGKHIWDKYQEYYLDLRDVIRKTYDPGVIENQMKSVGNKIILPSRLENGISELIELLRSNASVEAKSRKRKTVLADLDGFVDHPWKYL